MRWLFIALSLTLLGCYESHGDLGRPLPFDGGDPTRDAGTRDAGRPDTGPPPVPLVRALDLLLVVDNSSGMTEEQASLARELPTLFAILSTGDFNQDGDTDDDEDFEAIEDIHVAVVTTDMGTGGYFWPTCEDSDFGDDGLMGRRAGDCSVPSFVTWGGPASTEQLQCMTTPGDLGCGFEQPLEAALKALSPARSLDGTQPGYVIPAFYRNSVGHGDNLNAGFSRPGAVLAVLLVTNEDDCSTADAELFNPDSFRYSAPPNLRCFAHPEALHPIERYVDGLLGLRARGRVIVSAVAGVPTDLVPGPGERPDWERLIGPEASRDERMLERVDADSGDRLIPSCNIPGRGTANPPVRLLRALREMESAGNPVTVESICQESFSETLREIINALR